MAASALPLPGFACDRCRMSVARRSASLNKNRAKQPKTACAARRYRSAARWGCQAPEGRLSSQTRCGGRCHAFALLQILKSERSSVRQPSLDTHGALDSGTKRAAGGSGEGETRSRRRTSSKVFSSFRGEAKSAGSSAGTADRFLPFVAADIAAAGGRVRRQNDQSEMQSSQAQTTALALPANQADIMNEANPGRRQAAPHPPDKLRLNFRGPKLKSAPHPWPSSGCSAP